VLPFWDSFGDLGDFCSAVFTARVAAD